jgi:acetolactate synthase-1/2/3 large subunit
VKVSDWIAEFLKSKGLEYVFGVQGGAVTHLLDSCRSVGPRPIFCHHEQGAAFAAGGYARVRGYGACIATTGPGAANTLTGLLGAWQDHIPMMFISGQCRREHTSYGKPVRQVGTQECAITDVTCNWSKMAIFVADPGAVKGAFEAAYAESRRGRPGPVWLDVPVNVSWEQMP